MHQRTRTIVMVTVEDCKREVEKFVKIYPITKELHFLIRDTEAEMNYPAIYNNKAAYRPYVSSIDGKNGCIDIVASRHQDLEDVRQSLNHEILGHYALNTYKPYEKKLLLNSIISSKNELKEYWDIIKEVYPQETKYRQAEEVYCLMAETIRPEQHLGITSIREKGMDAFRISAQFNLKPLQAKDLENVVLMTAEGISDSSRQQQTNLLNDTTLERADVPSPKSELVM